MSADANDLAPTHARHAGMNPICRLFLLLLFFGSAGYFAYERDFVLAGLCAFTGVGAFSGYRAGLVYAMTWLAAIGTAILYAPGIGQTYESHFTNLLGTTGLLNRFVSIGIVGVLISFVLSSLAIMVVGRVLRKRPRLDSLNRWMGFAIGGVEGLAMCVCFLGGMLIIEPIEQERAPRRPESDRRGQMVSRLILTTAENTHASRVGHLIESYNPFVRLPQLNKVKEVQQTAEVLSDPAKIDGLLKHPSIQELQQRPEVKTAVAALKSDPKVQNILQSGRPMNREMAISLLSHPAILELVDQPGFLEEASKVIRGATKSGSM
ncbi:MAG: CvpA family protein [Rubripirellula sp.]